MKAVIGDSWRYFGCYGQVGHHHYEPGMHSVYDHRFPSFDGALCPLDRKPYVAALSRLGGIRYSTLAFWDLTVDSRPGSNCDAAPVLLAGGSVAPDIAAKLEQPDMIIWVAQQIAAVKAGTAAVKS